jgi:hypothetical protein
MDQISNDFFFPLRYLKSRKFYPRLSKRINTTSFTKNDLEFVTPLFIEEFNYQLSKYPREMRGKMMDRHLGNQTDIMNKETSLVFENIRFNNRGKNIFFFPENISSLFRKTDVNDIRLENIKFPYNTFYLAFGPQNDFDLGEEPNSENYFDGAYINKLSDEILEIRLTSSKEDRNYSKERDWFKNPDILHYISLHFSSVEETLTSAIDKHIAEAQKAFEEWENMPKKIDLDGEEIDVNPLSNQSNERQRRIRRVVENADKFREISGLIFNAICYLTYYDSEVSTFYTNNPSSVFIDKAKKAKSKRQKHEVEEKMRKGLFSKIKICGHSLKHIDTNKSLGNGSVASHWRRGHWRNQNYGSERSESRLIWIQPTLVRKDKGDPEQGHIYTVS